MTPGTALLLWFLILCAFCVVIVGCLVRGKTWEAVEYETNTSAMPKEGFTTLSKPRTHLVETNGLPTIGFLDYFNKFSQTNSDRDGCDGYKTRSSVNMVPISNQPDSPGQQASQNFDIAKCIIKCDLQKLESNIQSLMNANSSSGSAYYDSQGILQCVQTMLQRLDTFESGDYFGDYFPPVINFEVLDSVRSNDAFLGEF